MVNVHEQLETVIAELTTRFRRAPWHYFSENELHGEFFGLGRSRFGTATPTDSDIELPLFRHEYNTIWRYCRKPKERAFQIRFAERGQGDVGSLDFVILNSQFVQNSTLLVVINKDEARRPTLRKLAGEGAHPISAAIEFKMAHVRKKMQVSKGEIGALGRGMVEDCRKLAHEAPTLAYMLAFCHHDGPDETTANKMLIEGAREFSRIATDQRSLRLLLATPATTYLYGPWLSTGAFQTPSLVS